MTTSERIQAREADLATVSVPEAMETLSATGTAPLPADAGRSDASSQASAHHR